ncbi:transketolase, partial [Candidatus Pacebacteria bacterium]|nr:transketolase [Candidatus Paceibacterota bacterium]
MQYLNSKEVTYLEQKANEIRQSVVEMLVEAGSGHTAGPLGMADIFALLYFEVLKHDPKNPDWEERDRLVLSNGHICPVLYAAMAHAGYFEIEELMTLRKFGTRLQGHPHRTILPGIETSSGPLGSGLSQAVGMALA